MNHLPGTYACCFFVSVMVLGGCARSTGVALDDGGSDDANSPADATPMPVDGGRGDAGSALDGGAGSDAGPDAELDAGRVDAGPADAGPRDSGGPPDTGPRPDAGPPCRSDPDCADSAMFCNTWLGDCTGVGVCKARPMACSLLYAPVCGCDGRGYSSPCLAASLGISVANFGPCAP